MNFKQHLRTRGYSKTIIERSLSGVNFAARPSALTQKKKANERILPFVTTYHPAVNNLKQTKETQNANGFESERQNDKQGRNIQPCFRRNIKKKENTT